MANLIKSRTSILLFSVILVLTALSNFTKFSGFFILPTVLVVLFTTYLCESIKHAKEDAVMHYVIVCFIVALLFLALTLFNPAGFVVWLKSSTSDQTNILYFSALLLIYSFLISSMTYYLTYFVYRPLYLLVLAVMPMYLTLEKYGFVSPMNIIFLITSFILVLIEFNTLRNDKKTRVVMGNQNSLFIFSSALFVFVLIVSFLSPLTNFDDQKDDLMREVIQNIINPNNFNNRNSSKTPHSNPALDDSNLSDEIFAYVTSTEPVNLVSQAFGSFDGEKWFDIDFGTSPPTSISSAYGHSLNLADFYKLIMSYHGKESLLVNKFKKDIEKINVEMESKDLSVSGNRVNIPNLFTPNLTYKMDFAAANYNMTYFRTPHHEFFLRAGSTTREYSLSYYENIYFTNEKVREYVDSFTVYEIAQLLNELMSSESFYAENEKIFQYLYEDIYDVIDFEESHAMSYYSPKIEALALEITAGLTSPYDKANAVIEYFINSGYVYDLNYFDLAEYGKELDMEYFLFESKRGICYHYATSMVLLLQHVGVTARYVEGYRVQEPTPKKNEYYLRYSSGHAFPQVYANLIGWVTFEPTVVPDVNSKPPSVLDFLEDYSTIILVVVNLVIFGALGYYLAYSGFLKDTLYLKSLKNKSNEKQLIGLFSILNKHMGIITKKKNLSPKNLIGSAKALFDYDLSNLCDAFDRVSFNKETVSDDELAEFYEDYYNVKGAIKNYKKENKINSFKIDLSNSANVE